VVLAADAPPVRPLEVMTEAELIDAIGAEVAEHNSATPQALSMVEDGLKRFPKSARLWILRGDLIQVSDDDGRYFLDDALESYLAALRCDPDSAEANESIGHYLDAVQNEPEKAEPYFRRAIALGGGEGAQDGLKQVLEQLGRTE